MQGTEEEPGVTDSIFDRIIRREIPADIVHEDEDLVAFRDISPQAPVHVLFVPKRNYRSLAEVPADEAALLGRLLLAAAAYARKEGFSDDGYRIVVNTNRDGGQTVFHLHVHLLAGRAMHGGFG
jgi:histidine triad (HIT) family protein